MTEQENYALDLASDCFLREGLDYENFILSTYFDNTANEIDTIPKSYIFNYCSRMGEDESGFADFDIEVNIEIPDNPVVKVYPRTRRRIACKYIKSAIKYYSIH